MSSVTIIDAMPDPETPFDTIEGSQEYVSLIAEAIEEARKDVDADIASAIAVGAERRREALELVSYNLAKLTVHIATSHRILNDLRTLRRLLLGERTVGEVGADEGAADFTVTFQPDLTPEQVKDVLTALADYFRGCGGIGLRIEPELQELGVRLPVASHA